LIEELLQLLASLLARFMFREAPFACLLHEFFLSGEFLSNAIAERIEFSHGLLLSCDTSRIFHSAATECIRAASDKGLRASRHQKTVCPRRCLEIWGWGACADRWACAYWAFERWATVTHGRAQQRAALPLSSERRYPRGAGPDGQATHFFAPEPHAGG
jgi:hypothetical protein